MAVQVNIYDGCGCSGSGGSSDLFNQDGSRTSTNTIGGKIEAPLLEDGTLSTTGDCYANNAARQMIARQIEFVNNVFQFTNTGATIASPVGLAYEVVQVLAALRRGEYRDIIGVPGVSAGDVENTLRLSEWHTRLSEQIKESEHFGPLNRQELKIMIQKAHGIFFGQAVILPSFLDMWATFANMETLNEELASIANACEAGLTIADPLASSGGSSPAQLQTVQLNDLNLIAVEVVRPGVLLATGGQSFTEYDLLTDYDYQSQALNPIAIAVTWEKGINDLDHIDAPGARITVNDGTADDEWTVALGDDGTHIMSYGEATMNDALIGAVAPSAERQHKRNTVLSNPASVILSTIAGDRTITDVSIWVLLNAVDYP